MRLLLFNEDELRQIVTIAEAIKAVEGAFVALAEDRLNVPGDFAMSLPEARGQVQVKGAYLHRTPYYVVKIGSNFPDNPTLDLPTHSGLTAVFDAATGLPAAIMVDNGYLSTIRAGAAGALAAKYLAKEILEQVAVIGAGNQAYMQLKALMEVRPVGRVLVYARSPASADYYARRMVEDHDINIEITGSIEAAVRPADLIITATNSRRPLIKAAWLKPGVHITAVGCDKPNQQELHVEVLKRAEVIITDRLSLAATAGEIHHGLDAGVISRADVQGELADLIVGKIPGRTDPNQITVADLVGLDIQDTVVATLALEKALFLGLGQQVESQP